MKLRRTELTRLAAELTAVGHELAQLGGDAWTTTRQWQPGPRSTNLDPGRSSNTISDPTARAALNNDPDPHARLQDTVWAAVVACRDLRSMLHDATTLPQATRWCWWHERIGMKVPAYERLNINGKPACQWAYRIYRKTGQPPTPEQTRRHAEGDKVRVA